MELQKSATMGEIISPKTKNTITICNETKTKLVIIRDYLKEKGKDPTFENAINEMYDIFEIIRLNGHDKNEFVVFGKTSLKKIEVMNKLGLME